MHDPTARAPRPEEHAPACPLPTPMRDAAESADYIGYVSGYFVAARTPRDIGLNARVLAELDPRHGAGPTTTDGHRACLSAVEKVLGWNGTDYAMLVKLYGPSIEGERRCSPRVVIGTEQHWIMGRPDPKHISTSYAERQNLTMRMNIRRLTRLTNGHSKKVENHGHAVALHYMYYNILSRS